VASVTAAARCPVAHDQDMLEPGFLSDPFPWFRAQREATPIFYLPEVDLHVVTRYDDVDAIFGDRDTFGAANASSPIWPVCPEAASIMGATIKKKPTLNNADPPRHAPMRKAVRTVLGPRRIAAMEPTLTRVARDLILELAKEPTADLVSQLAFPLPGYAGFSLLGFPESDWDMVKAWCVKRVLMTYGKLTDEEQVEVANNNVAFWNYCEAHVSLREREPGNDITTDLIAYMKDNPDEIERNDLVIIVYANALAAHDSTTAAFESGMRHLLADREQWQALVDDPSLIPGAVEEMLRFDPPIMGHRRMVLRDTEVGGVQLKAGDQLLLAFVAAHRDPGHFEEPDRFDIRRADARTHFSFGKGVHLCLGAPLARLEMRVALQLLTEITPELRLVPEQEFTITPNLMFRSLERLLVETGTGS
jgi:cytochrome P450